MFRFLFVSHLQAECNEKIAKFRKNSQARRRDLAAFFGVLTSSPSRGDNKPTTVGCRRILYMEVETPIHAKQLSSSTPLPRQVRLAGTLDMIRYSARGFALKLSDGKEVQGVLDRTEMIETLSGFLNKKIVIVGKAIYRPSGAVLRVDVQHVEKDSGESALFSRIPLPILRKPSLPRAGTESSKTGTAAFFGAWPGDETDEQLLTSLKEMRG